MAASGGAKPLQWSVTSGQLPAGLTLDSNSGQITGVPTATGQSSVTIQVTDASAQTNSKAFTIQVYDGLDKYGGTPQLACPNGPAAHFYTEKIGNRWWLCTPAGNAFWMQAVYVVDTSDTVDANGVSYTQSVISKYGDADVTWGPQQDRRLLSWGFNSIGEYSSSWALPTTTSTSWPNSQQPVPMPFVGLINATLYALTNRGGYAPQPVKDLMNGVSTTVYTGHVTNLPDIWDPNFKTWLDGFLQNDSAVQQWVNGPNNDYFIGFNVDDLDYLLGFGAGPDFQPVTNGQATNDKAQPNLAWLILVSAPTQTVNNTLGITYSDTTNYSKQALMNFLEQRYGTIAALDLAWGATYTTFGIASGTLPPGTGFLDEVGANPWIPKDFVGLSDASATMQTDLNDFLLATAQQYFSMIKSEISLRAPGRLYLGPTSLGSWAAPARAQILQAAGASLDILDAPTIPEGVSDDQQRMDFIATNFGDKPWVEWEGFAANPDSYMSAYPQNDEVQAPPATQQARGQLYQAMTNLLINAHTSAGTYPIVGFKWWQLVDNANEDMNWGLVTRRDNEYDGMAAVQGSGTDSWGYPTGGEAANYGDFLDAVRQANFSILPTLLSQNW